MTVYVASKYRPKIAPSFHQNARFNHTCKHSHEKDILQIFKYLKGSSKNVNYERLIIYSSKKIQVDCYIDTDFSILHAQENHQDPVYVRSRTGYVIKFSDWPVM